MEHEVQSTDQPIRTPRQKLRDKINEKRQMRSKSYCNETSNNFNYTDNKNQKVLGFRKQQEFGLKKRIKP